MSEFLQILRSIGKRPGLFLATPDSTHSVWHLRSFLLGFETGRRCSDDSSIMNHFTPWLCTYYRVADGAMDWSGIIWWQAGKDNKAAFDLFFDLFEKYLKDRQEIGPEGIEARYKATLGKFPKQDDGQVTGTPKPEI